MKPPTDHMLRVQCQVILEWKLVEMWKYACTSYKLKNTNIFEYAMNKTYADDFYDAGVFWVIGIYVLSKRILRISVLF